MVQVADLTPQWSGILFELSKNRIPGEQYVY
jgi:hypothetical protein